MHTGFRILMLATTAPLLALGLLAPPTAALADPTDDAFAQAIALGKDATRTQAGLMDLDLDAAPTFAVHHATPSEAAFALVARHDAPLDALRAAQIRALDDLPAAQGAALAGVIDAFLGFDEATRTAYAGPAPDLAPVFRARLGLLDAARDLDRAIAGRPAAVTCSTTLVPPVLAIDFGCSNTYTVDVMLTIDLGGTDTYLNNAGGSGFAPSALGCIGKTTPTAGALLDLAGDDRYASGRSCGVNGGGDMGSGFLLDAQGTDTYTAGFGGVNGGGLGGAGFLLDGSGNDDYTARDSGTNGGGRNGAGLLVDLGGDDRYAGESYGVNGGAGGGVWGAGFLLDLAGNDRYTANSGGVNGGGFLGVGVLLDAAGTDTYQDDEGGSGTDISVVPKGIVGAQIDLTGGAGFLHPTVQPNPDGSCYVYNDSNGNGVRDPGEDGLGLLLGPLPCAI